MTGPIQNEASRLILEGTNHAEPGTFTHTASPENDVLINEGAARTLIYLAISCTPTWTRTPKLDDSTARVQDPLRRPTAQLKPLTQKKGRPPLVSSLFEEKPAGANNSEEV